MNKEKKKQFWRRNKETDDIKKEPYGIKKESFGYTMEELEATAKEERIKKESERTKTDIKAKMGLVYAQGVLDGQGKVSSNMNPFKLPKKEDLIDPIDPNRPIDEQRRLRHNWFQRQSYHKRTQEARDKKARIEAKAEEKAIETLAREKIGEKKTKKKATQEQNVLTKSNPKIANKQ